MVTKDGKQLARESSVARQSAKPQARHKVSLPALLLAHAGPVIHRKLNDGVMDIL